MSADCLWTGAGTPVQAVQLGPRAIMLGVGMNRTGWRSCDG